MNPLEHTAPSYANRVRTLEAKGMSTSDAQAVIGAEDARAERIEEKLERLQERMDERKRDPRSPFHVFVQK